jgi:hypothetical protein
VTAARRLIGTVVAFDQAAGLGDVETAGAGAARAGGAAGAGGGPRPSRFPFHCTQIADGSRTVAVGTRVTFGLLAGRAGRWEAADLRPASD